MTIEDYRWGGTAQGWALHAAGNEKMSEWLAAAERKQKALCAVPLVSVRVRVR
jgi:hypothetical protein